ncbi:MAG: cytidine/deoxycytidylate deaminase family protein [Candidatus Micrarchaeota archaeon]
MSLDRPDEKRVRPSWDEYFINMMELVAKRSTCRRHNIAAILVKDKRIIATGYNGAPRGTKDCLELGCLRDELKIPSGTRHEVCRAVHAEQNAIIQCSIYGVSCEGTTMYTNSSPCRICAKMIAQAGIKRLVFDGRYPDEEGLNVLKEAGVQVEEFKR